MTKKATVQPAKEEVLAAAITTPATEVITPPDPAAPPKPTNPVTSAVAVKKPASKSKAEKQAVAVKPTKKQVPVKPTSAATKENVAETPKAEKAPKVKKQAPKKTKLARDSFTMPEADYALFATLKQRALKAGIEVKKSEILRAAILTLSNLDDAELVKAIGLVERIKTGRPKK